MPDILTVCCRRTVRIAVLVQGRAHPQQLVSVEPLPDTLRLVPEVVGDVQVLADVLRELGVHVQHVQEVIPTGYGKMRKERGEDT